MNDMESKAPGLFVAGHARDGVSLGDSIVSGHNVAGRIQAFLAVEPERAHAPDHPFCRHEKHEPCFWSIWVRPIRRRSGTCGPIWREFLMDGRVLDAFYPVRWCIVHLAILPKRPVQ